MIANCPSCGTHYRHDGQMAASIARCGRCETELVLSALRPYRIMPPRPPTKAESLRAARYAPIGLDDPTLAPAIARNVATPTHAPIHPPVVRAVAPRIVEPIREPRFQPEPVPVPVPTVPAPTATLPPTPPAPTARLAPPEPVHVDSVSTPRASEPTDVGSVSTPRASEPDVPPVEPVASPDDAVSFWLWMGTFAIVGTAISWAMEGTTPAGLAWGAATGAVLWWGWRHWNSRK